jgi:hypothetical protein
MRYCLWTVHDRGYSTSNLHVFSGADTPTVQCVGSRTSGEPRALPLHVPSSEEDVRGKNRLLVVGGEIPERADVPEALTAETSRALQSDATLATTLLISAEVPHEAGPED